MESARWAAGGAGNKEGVTKRDGRPPLHCSSLPWLAGVPSELDAISRLSRTALGRARGPSCASA
eukprot:10555068-Alexandrium_andersonii.AAC.1